jgi:hypothetical protein
MRPSSCIFLVAVALSAWAVEAVSSHSRLSPFRASAIWGIPRGGDDEATGSSNASPSPSKKDSKYATQLELVKEQVLSAAIVSVRSFK